MRIEFLLNAHNCIKEFIMSITPLNITGTGIASAHTKNETAKIDPIVSTVTAAPTSEQTRANESDLSTAISTLNDYAKNNGAAINFSQDDETGKTIVKIVDKETNKVIRQIPSEEAIAISKSISKMAGLLIDKHV